MGLNPWSGSRQTNALTPDSPGSNHAGSFAKMQNIKYSTFFTEW